MEYGIIKWRIEKNVVRINNGKLTSSSEIDEGQTLYGKTAGGKVLGGTHGKAAQN